MVLCSFDFCKDNYCDIFDEIQVIELVVSVTTLKVYLIVNCFSFEAFCLSAVGFETTEGNNCNL